MRPPTILVLDAGAPSALLREVCAGAEEQGVPVSVTDAAGDATQLAFAAAGRSRLQVGIGLSGDGTVAVHHATLPEDSPPLCLPRDAQAAEWRLAGQLAARMVTRLPLPRMAG
ncbi:glycerol dehydratase reactivase beta/small subunit family protein [Pseudonocardia spinosispora]|uniref:glycerol dehydratase reactivase beta/small subunit family protein n=1 Tax=Pseudonocardia spinosispora TaxID=103441 RepID=UPI00048A5014|nr:glycerol dehydratase reactivase beta/small subunit family protein [Pseudonocardia spinosispora]